MGPATVEDIPALGLPTHRLLVRNVGGVGKAGGKQGESGGPGLACAGLESKLLKHKCCMDLEDGASGRSDRGLPLRGPLSGFPLHVLPARPESPRHPGTVGICEGVRIAVTGFVNHASVSGRAPAAG